MASNAIGGGAIDAEGFLKYLLHFHRTGYTRALNVTQRAAGANMSVDVNIDSSNFGGGLFMTTAGVPYFGYTNAAINATVATADPTNPRRDIVVAYIDLSLITTGTTNNLGAFKVKVVTGTAAASPSDPNAAAIQSSVGAGNPYVQLARVSLTAALGSITNAVITDLRTPAANAMPYLYGGSSNTVGHTVPNAADDTVALLNATQTVKGKSLSLTGNTATGNILTNPYKFNGYRNAALTIATGSYQRVPLDAKEFDTSSNLDVVTNQGRFTVPVTGFYWLQWLVATAIGGSNDVGVLYKNGVLWRWGNETPSGVGGGSGGSVLASLTAGDYIELYAVVGTSGVIGVGTSPYKTYFSGFLVSHL